MNLSERENISSPPMIILHSDLFLHRQLKEYKTDSYVIYSIISKKILIYMFCTNSEREIGFVWVCRTG